jgi:hypothetical protein
MTRTPVKSSQEGDPPPQPKPPAPPVLPRDFMLPAVKFMKGAIPEHITYDKGEKEFHSTWYHPKGKRLACHFVKQIVKVCAFVCGRRRTQPDSL